MQEVDAVAKACGLKGFRYVAFAPVEFESMPAAAPATAAPVSLELDPVATPEMLLPTIAATQANVPDPSPIVAPIDFAHDVVAEAALPYAMPSLAVVAADSPGPAVERVFSLLREVADTPPPVHTPAQRSPAQRSAARRTPRPASRAALAAARRT